MKKYIKFLLITALILGVACTVREHYLSDRTADNLHLPRELILINRNNSIPENFEVQFDNYYHDIRDLYFCNKKKDEAFFVIQIFDNTNTSVFVDNEQMLQKKIKIRGKEAWIMYNEFEDCGSLMIPDEKFSIFIVGDLSKKELIKIGENIK